MTVLSVVAELAYARFLEAYQQDNVWRSLMMDISRDFPGYGNSIRLPIDAGNDPTSNRYAVEDISTSWTVDAAITDQEWGVPSTVDANSALVTINKAIKVNESVSLLAEQRVRPSFLDSAMRNGARKVSEKVNKDIRDAVLAGATSTLDAITMTAANLADGGGTVKTDIRDKLGEAQLAADVAFWPQEGRVCVMSPRFHKYIVDQLISDNVYVTGLNNRAVTEGEVLRYRGWELLVDNATGDGTANTNDQDHTMFFFNRGVGTAFAAELARMRAIESETYMVTRILGVYTYGVSVIEPKKIRIMTPTVS